MPVYGDIPFVIRGNGSVDENFCGNEAISCWRIDAGDGSVGLTSSSSSLTSTATSSSSSTSDVVTQTSTSKTVRSKATTLSTMTTLRSGTPQTSSATLSTNQTRPSVTAEADKSSQAPDILVYVAVGSAVGWIVIAIAMAAVFFYRRQGQDEDEGDEEKKVDGSEVTVLEENGVGVAVDSSVSSLRESRDGSATYSSTPTMVQEKVRRRDSESTLLPPDDVPVPISISVPISNYLLPLIKTPTPWIILPAAILHVFCFSLCLLPLQAFLLQQACASLGIVGDDECRQSEDASSLAASWLATYTLCGALPTILATPIIGMMLDSFGRRPIIVASSLVFLINIVSFIAVGNSLPLWVIFAGNFVCGALGGFMTLLLGMQSYLSDTVSEASRTQFFSFTEALLMFAGFVAPMGGGYAATYMGPLGSFYLAFGIELVVVVYCLLLIPESLTAEKRKLLPQSTGSSSSRWGKRLSSIRAVFGFAWASVITSFQTLEGRSKTILAIFLFAGETVSAGITNFMILYFSLRFNWSFVDIGQYLFITSFYRLFYLGLVLPGLVYLFIHSRAKRGSGIDAGISKERFAFDVGLVRVAWLLIGLGYLGIGLATEGWMMYFISFGYGFGYTGYPTARSILSRCVPADEQGRLFAALNIMASIAGSVGPFLFGIIYYLNPQSIMFCMSGYTVFALILLSFVKGEELAGYALESGAVESVVHEEASF
ncbi:hypothetical protein HDU97_004537 [Phlyctochytrium planicorne]|nr:hypothetical protein HDU97_004537 [Phlyctochytrium planicorne]